MNKNYELNKIITVKEKASLVTIASRIKTVQEERRLQVLLLLLPLLLLLSMEMFKHKLISNVETIWDKVFKNGQRKICGRQPLKSFTWPILEYLSHLLPYENASLKKTSVTVDRRKENKQICSKTSLQMKIKMFI